MSRFSLILLIIVLAVVALLVGLSFVDTESAPTTVEKAMLNDAQAQ